MKIVKLKDYRKRPPDPRVEMRLALMELLREARAGKSEEQDNSWPMRSARFIGASASRIHRIIVSLPFRILFIAGLAYLALHLAGISVEIIRNGDVILSVR